MLAKASTIAASLLLAGCTATLGETLSCDIHRIDPPQHYVDAGRQQTVLEVPLRTEADVAERCPQTTVGCATQVDLAGVEVWLVYFIMDPSPWGLTRQQVIDHEYAHVGGWNRCHNN